MKGNEIGIVEGLVIVELKSVGRVSPAHKKQLLTYLKLTTSLTCSWANQ